MVEGALGLYSSLATSSPAASAAHAERGGGSACMKQGRRRTMAEWRRGWERAGGGIRWDSIPSDVWTIARPHTITIDRHRDMFCICQLPACSDQSTCYATPDHDVELCRHRKRKIPKLLYNRETFLQFATNCLLFTLAAYFFSMMYLPLRLTWHVGQGQKFMCSAIRHSVLEDHLFILQSKHCLRLCSFFLIIAGTIICCASKRLSYSIHDISI
jgi:hypothetical protein